MLAEIQVAPRPAGTATDRYAYVDAAIAIITASGLAFEVGALGTTLEGPPEEVWRVLRAAQEAAIAAGADSCSAVIKVAQAADEAAGPTMTGLTAKHRP